MASIRNVIYWLSKGEKGDMFAMLWPVFATLGCARTLHVLPMFLDGGGETLMLKNEFIAQRMDNRGQ